MTLATGVVEGWDVRRCDKDQPGESCEDSERERLGQLRVGVSVERPRQKRMRNEVARETSSHSG